jgi:hypothetical protein
MATLTRCYCVWARIVVRIVVSSGHIGHGCIRCIEVTIIRTLESALGTKRSGKGRRKQGRKKRRMRAKIRHRKK